MTNISNDDIKQYECIVYRPFRYNEFSIRKTYVDPRYNSNVFYTNLKDKIKHPQISNNKHDGTLFKIGIVSDNSINTMSPIEIYTRLIIDYDNLNEDKNLLRKFKNKFKDYSYMLYTSFSSKRHKPKFRVIIKLKKPIYSEQLNSPEYRRYLCELFSIDKEYPDETCFRPYQLQLLPITSNMCSYEYFINKGKKLELDDFFNVLNTYTSKQISNYADRLNKQVEEFKFINLINIHNLIMGKVFPIDNTDEEKELHSNLVKVHDKNYCETPEYKRLSEEINKGTKEEKYFENKFEFNKYYAAMIAHNKTTLEKVEKEFERLYGCAMKTNERRYNDLLNCVEKFKGNR